MPGPAPPNPPRSARLRAIFEVSRLDDVADAVAVATEGERRVYVERVGGGWRWSLVHPGGSYPLLRITARFLGLDYTSIQVPFRTLDNGMCVVAPEPFLAPDVWAIVEFDGPTTADVVRDRIVVALGDEVTR